MCDYLWRRSLEFDGGKVRFSVRRQRVRVSTFWGHFETLVEVSRSERHRPNGGSLCDGLTSGHFSPGSTHFSAMPTLFLDPTPHPHLAESPQLRAWFTALLQHFPDTKLPGLLDLRDFYCTTLHCSSIVDGVLHNIWWYKTCQPAEIGIIGLDWTLWGWSISTDSVPGSKLERLDIDMHVISSGCGPTTRSCEVFFSFIPKRCRFCFSVSDESKNHLLI